MEEKINSQTERQELSPVKLSNDEGTKSGSESKSEKEFVKLHAETMGIAPKGPIDTNGSGSNNSTLPSKSLKQELTKGKGGIFGNAQQVNVMPMILMDTDAESEEKALTDRDCEKAQLSDLWEATMNRSQDIQFVVQKLMPSSDANRTTTFLMRLISTMVTTGVGAAPAFGGYGPSTAMGSQMILNTMNQLIGGQEARVSRRAQINNSEAIMLYQMVRNTAEKVTETYRDYKLYVRRIDSAQMTALKLQNMIREARAGQDAAEQIMMEYWGDKARADIEEAVYRARRFRQSLIDLAGAEAVSRLDQSFQDQLIAEKEVESPPK